MKKSKAYQEIPDDMVQIKPNELGLKAVSKKFVEREMEERRK